MVIIRMSKLKMKYLRNRQLEDKNSKEKNNIKCKGRRMRRKIDKTKINN